MTKTSILQTVRSEGYRDGYGQASMVQYDAEYQRGYDEARAEIVHSRRAWWLFGIVCGGLLSALVAQVLA